MWDGDPRQVLQVLVSSNATWEPKVHFKTLVPNGEAQLSSRYVRRGAIGLSRLVQHWGSWLQTLIQNKTHLLVPPCSWVRRELWPGEVGHSTFLGVLVPPKQRCCCFWDFPAGFAPLVRLSNVRLLRLLQFLGIPSCPRAGSPVHGVVPAQFDPLQDIVNVIPVPWCCRTDCRMGGWRMKALAGAGTRE